MLRVQENYFVNIRKAETTDGCYSKLLFKFSGFYNLYLILPVFIGVFFLVCVYFKGKRKTPCDIAGIEPGPHWQEAKKEEEKK